MMHRAVAVVLTIFLIGCGGPPTPTTAPPISGGGVQTTPTATSRPATVAAPTVAATPTTAPAKPTVAPAKPTIAPTAASTEATIKQLAATQFGNRLRRVSYENLGVRIVQIEYTGAALSPAILVRSAATEFKTFAPKAFAIPEVGIVDLQTFGEFTDTAGKASQSVAIRITMKRATASKVDWAGVDPKNLGRILAADGDTVFTHPALRAAWADYTGG